MNSVGESGRGAGATLDAFSRMEDKVNRMMDEADAMEELNEKPSDSIDALAAKYEDSETDSGVDDELAALKAEMGM